MARPTIANLNLASNGFPSEPARDTMYAVSDSRVPLAPRAVVLERFRLERPLPWRGRSRFFEASDVRSPARRVAVKTVDPLTPSAAWLLDRLRREAQLGVRVASSGQRGWLPLFDYGDDLLVMELFPGVPIDEAVPLGGWDFGEARARLTAVAQTLSVAHAQGIAHRELSPRKVLIGVRGDVRLIDLGAGSVGAREGILEDVRSLGALLYLAMSGRAPPTLEQPNEPAVEDGPITQRPPDLKLVRPEAPSPAAELVLACMHPDPMRRPESASEVADALRSF